MSQSIKPIEPSESITSYCKRLSRKNNGLLYMLERYLDKPLMSDKELMKIREHILTVSADIERLSERIGDQHERLL